MIFDKIIERRAKTTYGTLDKLNDFWYSVIGRGSHSGVSVNRHNAMGVSMVVTCVLLRSNTLASFPLKVKRKVGEYTEDAKDHPLYSILHDRPNPDTTSWKWRQSGQANTDLTGNEYGWIERSRRGVRNVWPIPSENVEIVRASGEDVKIFRLDPTDTIVYVVKVKGGKFRIPAKDMLHFIGSSYDGISGVSVISYAANTVGTRISLDRFQSRWMEKGMHISGVLEHPETIKDKEKFKEALRERYAGSVNAGAPLILENGMKYNAIKVSLADQQFIEQANLSDLQIARMFQCPPSRVGIQGINESNNSLENENRRFLDTTMLPIVVSREEEMSLKLLTDRERKAGYRIKFNYDALLRPDTKSRAEIDQMYFGMGMPLNRMLERDDLDPVEGGDKSYVPLNFAPAEQVTNPPPQPDARKLETRSIAARDNIKLRWKPIIEATARQLVNYEANAVSRQAQKAQKERAEQNFSEWMDEFYQQFEGRITENMGRVLREYMLSVATEARNEVDPAMDLELIKPEIESYIGGLARQWRDSSTGQLNQIMDEVEEDIYQAVINRSEEWRERKVEKVTERQSTGAANAVAYAVFSLVGASLVWRTRGADTCKYCRTLDGKTVQSRGVFVDMDGVDPGDGDTVLQPKGMTRYPPLHAGCDCYISASR